jgi:proline iminopeptidase
VHTASPRELFVAHLAAAGRPPRLHRHTVRVRGLDFAVWTSHAVDGAVPLVCVNGGLLFDHRLLWPALAPLARHRQLVLYDQRGRGHSSAPPGARAARIEHDAGDLAALRQALGIHCWDVLGHSWGGGVAMLGVAQDQAAVRRLVLANAVGIDGRWLPALHEAGLRRLAAADPAAHHALAAFDPAALEAPDPAVHVAYARAFYPAWFADPTLPRMFAAPRSTSVTGAAIAARLRRDGYDWAKTLRALRIPSLVIHGEEDVLSADEARRTSSTLQDARLSLLAGAGHMPFWEAPDRFFPLVDAFLSAESPAR